MYWKCYRYGCCIHVDTEWTGLISLCTDGIRSIFGCGPVFDQWTVVWSRRKWSLFYFMLLISLNKGSDSWLLRPQAHCDRNGGWCSWCFWGWMFSSWLRVSSIRMNDTTWMFGQIQGEIWTCLWAVGKCDCHLYCFYVRNSRTSLCLFFV